MLGINHYMSSKDDSHKIGQAKPLSFPPLP